MHQPIPHRYGVIEQTRSTNEIEYAIESLRHLGYAVITGDYATLWLDSLSHAFERAHARSAAKHGGWEALAKIEEHNTIRLPLAYESIFLELASNEKVAKICKHMIGQYVVLNQQNGVISPPHSKQYNQGAWHRDL